MNWKIQKGKPIWLGNLICTSSKKWEFYSQHFDYYVQLLTGKMMLHIVVNTLLSLLYWDVLQALDLEILYIYNNEVIQFEH